MVKRIRSWRTRTSLGASTLLRARVSSASCNTLTVRNGGRPCSRQSQGSWVGRGNDLVKGGSTFEGLSTEGSLVVSAPDRGRQAARAWLERDRGSRGPVPQAVHKNGLLASADGLVLPLCSNPPIRLPSINARTHVFPHCS